ncbi:hypothetical protein RSAG8_13236, partial [Rhizoctonia solani AG-8 WAC10335]
MAPRMPPYNSLSSKPRIFISLRSFLLVFSVVSRLCYLLLGIHLHSDETSFSCCWHRFAWCHRHLCGQKRTSSGQDLWSQRELLTEPWMLPNEWVDKMGGERCDADCSSCAASEFGLVKKLGQEKADQVFAEHWATWFTEKDVDEIVAAGLNSVRIPLGYWIVESLVDRQTEYYPRGGMKYLKKGLGWLKKKGIHVMLDHHALPGVATANQMFAGRCTSDVQFYTEKNYRRALIWAGVMTALTHLDPDFSSVFAIEAINEPIMDANLTPGYGDYQKRFVKVVRMVEYALGIKCPDTDYTKLFSNSSYTDSLDLGFLKVATYTEDEVLTDVFNSITASLKTICAELGLSLSLNLRRTLDISLTVSPMDVAQKLAGHGAGRGQMSANGAVLVKRSEPAEHLDTHVPHGSSLDRHNARRRLHHERGISPTLSKDVCRTCLMTSFQNRDWQYNNPPNPADAAIGPQLYDAHLYFSFGVGSLTPTPSPTCGSFAIPIVSKMPSPQTTALLSLVNGRSQPTSTPRRSSCATGRMPRGISTPVKLTAGSSGASRLRRALLTFPTGHSSHLVLPATLAMT